MPFSSIKMDWPLRSTKGPTQRKLHFLQKISTNKTHILHCIGLHIYTTDTA